MSWHIYCLEDPQTKTLTLQVSRYWCKPLIPILCPVYPYHGQVGTAGLHLVLYVGHLSYTLHPAILGVAEVSGGVDVSVELVQLVNAKGRGIQGIVAGGEETVGEDSQKIAAFPAFTLSHLLQQGRRGS